MFIILFIFDLNQNIFKVTIRLRYDQKKGQIIFCYTYSPSKLANCFIVNNDLNKSYNLRNLLELKIPDKGKYNDYGEDTFDLKFKIYYSQKKIILINI